MGSFKLIDILLNSLGETTINIAFRPLLFQLQLAASSLFHLAKNISSLIHPYSIECCTFSSSDLRKALILTLQ